MTKSLSSAEFERYARQLLLPEIGRDGQERLRRARVLVVGAGGLGSPAALYLAAAGVGTLGLVDGDPVERSNLHRQLLYSEAEVGRAKVDAAAERLRAASPHLVVEAHPERFGVGNGRRLAAAYDLVVDGTDNFAARYLINDAAALERRAVVHGAIERWSGQVSVLWAERGPCYRCLFPEPPPAGLVPSCAEAGVVGVVPGVIGTLQAVEALKLLLGVGEPLIGRLVLYDALAANFRELRLAKRADCPLCSPGATIRDLEEVAPSCAAETEEDLGWEIEVEELNAWRRSGRPHRLLDVRNPDEFAYAAIPGALLVPLAELPRRLAELSPEATTVVYCHHGPRSASAVGFLRGRGFARAVNLAGGIDAWSRRVDPTVPRY